MKVIPIIFLLLCTMQNVFAQNRETRTEVEYHDNVEKVKEKYEYYYDFWSEQNVKHGRYSLWNQKGQLLIDCTYFEGKLDGTYTLYDRNGAVLEVREYDQAMLQGRSISFSKKGIKQTELYYKEGKLNGLCKYYFGSGELKKEVAYQEGVPHGTALFYTKQGELKKTVNYIEGKAQEEISLSSEHTLTDTETH